MRAAAERPSAGKSAERKPRAAQTERALFVQRTAAREMACACGGGCPRCRKNYPLQAKLEVSQPGDALEHEADRVAEQVMRMPALRPGCPCGGGCPACVARMPATSISSGDGPVEAPALVHAVLAAPGEPLGATARTFMEPRFGRGFGGVRVHTGAQAAASADAIGAQAYTRGQHVVFGAGGYRPGTPAGDHLLAHELAHTVQQGAGSNTVQRALKFEFQTKNHVWAAKKTGASDPKLLPRKYAATTVGYKEGAGEERGDKPAFLSVGRRGGPALPAGAKTLVEVEGPPVMKEAKSGVDPALPAQFVKTYRFKTAVKASDLVGKPVTAGQLVLDSEIDNATLMAGGFNPNIFEFKYVDTAGTPLHVHLDEDHKFASGHVKLMKVGRRDRADIDKRKPAQHVEVWKLVDDPTGRSDFGGKPVRLELVSAVDHAKDASMKGKFNPDTWNSSYFLAVDISGGAPVVGAVALDVHEDEDGRLQTGKVKLMEKKKSPAAQEQTAMELQSEHGSFIEFETPKWFRDRSDLEDRVQDAVDMTKAMDAEIGTPREVTDATTLAAIEHGVPGTKHVVEWPAELSTSHLTNLNADKRRLLVQITHPTWLATIQASESIDLSRYPSLLEEHEFTEFKDAIVPSATNLFNTAFSAAKAKNPSLDESRFADLKGFVHMVAAYIARAQVFDMAGQPAKFAFRLMARTDFGSMHDKLLSADERTLFKTMVGDPKKPTDNPILTELEPRVNGVRAGRGLASVTLTRKSPVFFHGVGTASVKGPTIHAWLDGITHGTDKLTGKDISDAMGAKPVVELPGDKDYKRAKFEVRGTVAHGGNFRPAAEWKKFALDVFDAAAKRGADTPDDPTTPKIDESTKAVLKP